MSIKVYTDIYFESLKLFQHFGSALALGFKDIKDKANDILGNQKTIKGLNIFPDNAPETNLIE